MSNSSQDGISRRGFFRGAIAGAAALQGTGLLGQEALAEPTTQPALPPASFDFTNQSGALKPDESVDSACQFCNSLCRLKVHKKAGRVIDIQGETADPVQAGGLCVKASMMTQILYNKNRLTTPLKRVGGAKGSSDSKFEATSWDDALGIIAKKFISLRDAGEAHKIANKTSGRLPRGTGSLVGRFFELLGSPNNTDVGPVCNDAGGNALAWTFGLGNFTNGYGVDPSTGKEDLGSSNFFLFFGTNQAETHPVTFAHLLRCRQKTGAKLIVIDPRLTPTGAEADEWIAPKPHTDMAVVLAMLHHIVTHDLYDHSFVEKWVLGFDELKRHLLQNKYTPQWAQGVCDVPAEKITEIAEGYAKAKPAAIFCNAGISHQMSAFDTYRTLAFLAAITGNIGTPGGGCNFMHNTWPGGLNLPPRKGVQPPKPKVASALPVGPDRFPAAIMAGDLKAIITCGNPIIGSANTRAARQAYEKLEFYVYTGLFMEEAAFYADVILPVTSGLEFEGVYMRRDDRAIRWQKQAAPRVGESKTDIELWIELAHAMEKHETAYPPGYWEDNFPAGWKDYRTLWGVFVANTPGMGGMTAERMEKRAEPLRWPCPGPEHPGVSTLYLDHPSWYAATESLDPAFKGKRFLTKSGKAELFTPAMEKLLAESGHLPLPVFYTHPEVTGKNAILERAEHLAINPVNPQALMPRLRSAESTGEVHKDFPLMGTTGRPSVVHFSGITQWTYTGKQMNGIRLVQIHPTAARAAGIKDGDDILIESPRGSITGTALLWHGIRPDTIFVPNLFGPMQKLALEFGEPLYEPVNTLIDDQYFDNLSGQQAYKCFACRVKKA